MRQQARLKVLWRRPGGKQRQTVGQGHPCWANGKKAAHTNQAGTLRSALQIKGIRRTALRGEPRWGVNHKPNRPGKVQRNGQPSAANQAEAGSGLSARTW